MTGSRYDATVSHLAASRIRFATVMGELARGKSVIRGTFNSRINGLPVQGTVLDLGARNRSSSYYRFLNTAEADITFCDFEPQDTGMLRVDLEQPLPFADRSFDVVLLFFVLNYIWNAAPLLSEIRRVCRSHAVIGTSLVDQYNPEPHDYTRYTGEGLSRLITEAGFPKHRIFPISHGPCTLALAALQQTAFFAPGATALYPLIWGADTLMTRFAPQRLARRTVMTHIAVLSNGGPMDG